MAKGLWNSGLIQSSGYPLVLETVSYSSLRKGLKSCLLTFEFLLHALPVRGRRVTLAMVYSETSNVSDPMCARLPSNPNANLRVIASLWPWSK